MAESFLTQTLDLANILHIHLSALGYVSDGLVDNWMLFRHRARVCSGLVSQKRKSYCDSPRHAQVSCARKGGGKGLETRPDGYAALLFGTANVTKTILLHFRKNRAGTIVTIGSSVGWCGNHGGSAYSCAKSGLEGIRSLLVEPRLFRTQTLSQNNMRQSACVIQDYAPTIRLIEEFLTSNAAQEPGDSKKSSANCDRCREE
ncbi:hypothetical protein AJ79_00255 [Helicocarpus griseus UAMH5409]|uniref:3-oxoacyl-[acyl-carrier-protein] reductase n=1 Tax=Helicocarpus griseus UAMH5409 TaxID=1447875 RepID=A0A2B7YD97_9EURO|nr:hypothetical protein AJ79_00255 [Helicocarpus griseus UAMH5409]